MERHPHPYAKLSDDDVREIRASSEPGNVLAERYGVSAATISGTRRGARNDRDNPKPIGRPRKERPLCACGCGQRVTSPSRRWVNGHAATGPQAAWRTNPHFTMPRQAASNDVWLERTLERCEEVDRGYEVDGEPSPCLLWTGGRMPQGYVHCRRANRTTTRHREIYAIAHPDEDLTGRQVDHLCAMGKGDMDARRCMNVDHLSLKTTNEHARRHHSNLDRDTVEHIRARYAAGERVVALAREYGYAQGAMSMLISGRRWSDAA